MRFLVDGMLGGLARWLRILGHNVTYDTRTEDNDLLQTAKRNQMILLTSDEELYRRSITRGVHALLVKGRDEEERLVEVAREFNLPLDVNIEETRCPECGGQLRDASKEKLRGIVPEKSLLTYDRFWLCTTPSCGKVYWRGSHWTQIEKTLEQARRRLVAVHHHR